MYIDSGACTCMEIYEPQHVYRFSGPCVETGKTVVVDLPAAGLYALRRGAHIQDAFPGLSAADREFVLTGLSGEGWQRMFGLPDVPELDAEEFDLDDPDLEDLDFDGEDLDPDEQGGM